MFFIFAIPSALQPARNLFFGLLQQPVQPLANIDPLFCTSPSLAIIET
jgi:hypothetical protein